MRVTIFVVLGLAAWVLLTAAAVRMRSAVTPIGGDGAPAVIDVTPKGDPAPSMARANVLRALKLHGYRRVHGVNVP